MKAVLNPIGPEEPTIYWKRRALVVGGVVAVFALIIVLLTSGSSGSKTATKSAGESSLPLSTISPSGSPSPDDTGLAALNSIMQQSTVAPTPGESLAAGESVAPSESLGASADPLASDSASPEESESASASASGGTCADGDISVVATLSGQQTTVGNGLGVTMTVTNRSSVACTRDVGPTANEIKILSGGTKVWSSDDCSSSSGSSPKLLAPGESFTTSVRWPGTSSSQGCSVAGKPSGAGAYAAVARNGSLTSPRASFVVSG